jgi:hypothetical protein
MCDGLENKSYHIKNQEYSKADYEKKSKEYLDQKKLYPDFYSALSYQ